MSDNYTPRRPLHEKSNSQSNVQAAIRLVPSTPPQRLGLGQNTNYTRHPPHDDNEGTSVHPTNVTSATGGGNNDNNARDEIYSRTPLPTHPSHILGPGKGKTRAAYNFATTTTNPTSPTSPVTDETTTPHLSPQSTGSTHFQLQPAHNATFHTQSATGSPSIKPRAPAKKRLQIHKDGRTFSLLRDDSQPVEDVRIKSPISSPVSRTSFDSLPSYASNTEGRNSSLSASYALDEDSTLTTIPGTPPPPQSTAEDQNKPSVDPVGSSPWNYSLVGGVRKVPKTPDLKQKGPVSSESPLPPLPEASSEVLPSTSQDLSTKQSFQSATTVSTASENSNYKVYRYRSPVTTEPSPAEVPSSSDSNYQIIQESSEEETSVIYRPRTSRSETEDYGEGDTEISRNSSIVRRPQTSSSDANYVLHDDLSPSASFLDLPYPNQYSQESLVVPALKPKPKRSNERLGYYKSRSRESLRSRSGSIRSISTVLSQREALKAIVSSGFLVNLPPLPSRGPNSWAEPSNNYPQRSYMNEHPHQWSSQLSTVLSVSDGGSERNSRSWSDATGGRSSAGPASRGSRPVYSIGSSSFAQDDPGRYDFPEPPRPTFNRNGVRHPSTSSIRMIESQDEYGDGITDLQDLRSRPSRGRLSGFYSIGSEPGRTNTMRSTSSSRANSLLANTIPTWAKLYYGSGERRYLGAPGSSTEASSRSNSFRSRSGSPNTDHFPLSIYSPRRRPREGQGHGDRRVERGSMEIRPAPNHGDDGNVIEGQYGSRFRTWSMSSVWSPHLRLDRRAMRQSIWEPPSVNWSTEGSWFGRRNVQIIMFITGFIMPFAWMIAALLPLPPRPLQPEMQERDNSTSNLGISNDNFNDYERQFGPMDEARYESARWWRRLNRWMSLVGALIIAAIIILVVVSLREGW